METQKKHVISSLVYVLTVPMRNGNIITSFFSDVCIRSSYRTYEEWKLSPTLFISSIIACSYRTYEEWKHDGTCNNPIPSSSSYRTYEEWKRASIFSYSIAIFVLTVPMRNGNILFICAIGQVHTPGSYRTYEEWKPMAFFGAPLGDF